MRDYKNSKQNLCAMHYNIYLFHNQIYVINWLNKNNFTNNKNN